MFFLILLGLITPASIVIYLAAWPVAKPWHIRLGFDVPVLLVFFLLCITVRPVQGSNPMEAAEVAQWRSYLSVIYLAAISILFLSAAGTLRYFVFRERG